VFLDRVRPIGHLAKFPRLQAWTDVLLARESTHSFPPAELEAMYRANLKARKVWVSQFIDGARAAAE
jgi:glutathione S-transferase